MMQVFGKVQDDSARIEVACWRKRGEAGVIYLTKYSGTQIGERSVGMSAEAAQAVALLLAEAVNRKVMA